MGSVLARAINGTIGLWVIQEEKSFPEGRPCGFKYITRYALSMCLYGSTACGEGLDFGVMHYRASPGKLKRGKRKLTAAPPHFNINTLRTLLTSPILPHPASFLKLASWHREAQGSRYTF